MRKLSFILNSKAVKMLKAVAKYAGVSKAEALRTAILLFAAGKRLQDQGGHMAIIDKDGNKTKLLFPSVTS